MLEKAIRIKVILFKLWCIKIQAFKRMRNLCYQIKSYWPLPQPQLTLPASLGKGPFSAWKLKPKRV